MIILIVYCSINTIICFLISYLGFFWLPSSFFLTFLLPTAILLYDLLLFYLLFSVLFLSNPVYFNNIFFILIGIVFILILIILNFTFFFKALSCRFCFAGLFWFWHLCAIIVYNSILHYSVNTWINTLLRKITMIRATLNHVVSVVMLWLQVNIVNCYWFIVLMMIFLFYVGIVNVMRVILVKPILMLMEVSIRITGVMVVVWVHCLRNIWKSMLLFTIIFWFQ